MRKYFLDHIRWITVLTVLFYHVLWIFNSLGVIGGLEKFKDNQPWDVLLTIIYPWFMILLYLIAGISAKYALDFQSNKQFIKNKIDKLLIPSTLGLIGYQSFIGYLNLKIGKVWDKIPFPMNVLIAILSSVGPLWFVQMLFIFSILIVLIKKINFSLTLYNYCKKINIFILLLLGFVIWGSSMILNTPVIIVFRWGIYFTVYLMGYFIFSHDEIQELIKKYHFIFLQLAFLFGLFYTYIFYRKNYVEQICLSHPLTNFYAWYMTLAILGYGKLYLDKEPKQFLNSNRKISFFGKLSNYMIKNSFGIYVVHYLLCLGPGYYLKFHTNLRMELIYLIDFLTTFLLSPLIFEILKRIPIIRYINFGIREEKIKKIYEVEKNKINKNDNLNHLNL